MHGYVCSNLYVQDFCLFIWMCVDVVTWSPLAEDAPEYTAEQMHATIQGVAFEEKVELNLAWVPEQPWLQRTSSLQQQVAAWCYVCVMTKCLRLQVLTLMKEGNTGSVLAFPHIHEWKCDYIVQYNLFSHSCVFIVGFATCSPIEILSVWIELQHAHQFVQSVF